MNLKDAKIVHLTLTGYLAGQCLCGCDKSEASEAGAAFAHAMYAPLGNVDINYCAECLAVWNDDADEGAAMTHIDQERIRARNAAQALSKLDICLRNAKECSRNTWQHSPTKAHRREYKRLRREAMNDARYWRDELKRNTEG